MKLFVPPSVWGWDRYRPDLVGIATGGCVANRSWGNQWAHAHCRRKGNEPFGWICIRFEKWTTTPDGRPTPLLLHELAHIITDEEHNQAWADKLTELGGKVDPGYGLLMFKDQRPHFAGGKNSIGGTLRDIEKSAARLESKFKGKRF